MTEYVVYVAIGAVMTCNMFSHTSLCIHSIIMMDWELGFADNLL